MNNIDFSTDKAVIVYALQGDGSRYIPTLLGLSDSSMLMSNRNESNLTETQLEFYETFDDKITYIKKLINSANKTKIWNDFNISTNVCFGSHKLLYNLGFSNTPNLLPFNDIVKDIVNSDRYFFMCVHTPGIIKQMLEVWRHAKVVVVVHSPEFIYRYRKGTVVHNEPYGFLLDSLKKINWDDIRGRDYQLLPPSNARELINNKSVIIKDYGEEFFNKTLEKFNYADKLEAAKDNYFNELQSKNKLCFFNADAYLDDSFLISEIKKLYKFLNLKEIDFNCITPLHKEWLNTIATVNYKY